MTRKTSNTRPSGRTTGIYGINASKNKMPSRVASTSDVTSKIKAIIIEKK
ncbi:MAG: hypothetical protein ACNA7V_12295 [Bacteroidales bacterium]|jgi:hypothetical protein